jgi:hypothetical protein
VFVADEGSFAMPFMVIYRTSDGSSRFEQSEAIDEAALFVERLRNSEGIDQIRIYRMEEIGFAFRPYYKVELGLPDRNRSEDSAEDHRSAAAPLTSRQPFFLPRTDRPPGWRDRLARAGHVSHRVQPRPRVSRRNQGNHHLAAGARPEHHAQPKAMDSCQKGGLVLR